MGDLRSTTSRTRKRLSLERPLIAGLLLAIALLLPHSAAAQTVAEDFDFDVVASGLNAPTAMDVGPAGEIYVSEKAGIVKRINPSGTIQQVLDIRSQVGTYKDRGLMGIAVDSQFATHPYVYVVYTVKPTGLFENAATTGRLVRYTVSPTGSLSGATTILGTVTGQGCPAPSDTVNCLPAEGGSHTPDLVRSAPDGTLYYSGGDAQTSRNRALDIRSAAGKVLHVDRNGRGLPGHPFCAADNDLTHMCTKVHATGFRNPWRITLNPANGSVIVGDVGENSFEEINFAVAGKSYGWPCYEGPARVPGASGCAGVYGREGTALAELGPWWHYGRDVGISVVGGPVYTGSSFPAPYQGSVLVADTIGSWIRAVRVEGGTSTPVAQLGTGFVYPVHLQATPDGEALYVVEHGSGRILRVFATDSNRRPRAVATATPSSPTSVPATVQFDGTQSSDPDGDPLTYSWTFGDGSVPATGSTASHTYTSEGVFRASLTVTDAAGATDTHAFDVTVGERPVVTIDAPAPGTKSIGGQPLALQGHAVDPGNGPVPDANLRWKITLHHAAHQHAFQDRQGSTAELLPASDHDLDSYYEITLFATDASGLTGSSTIEVQPKTVQLTMTSTAGAPGTPMTFAGTSFKAPMTRTVAAGYQVPISTVDKFYGNGQTWLWLRWQHGGSRTQTYTVPAQDTTATAVYRAKTGLDDVCIALGMPHCG